MENKFENRHENKLKDRGDEDLKKNIEDKPRRKATDSNKINVKANLQLERGDSERKPSGKKIPLVRNQARSKQNYKNNENDKAKSEKFKLYPNFEEIRNYELEKRRLLREKYTFRYNNTSNGSPNYSEKGDNGTPNTDHSENSQFVERITKKQGNNKQAGNINESGSPERTKADKETEKKETKRKPIIKTITSPSDKAKIYKAVTFVDKPNSLKPLQINLITNVKKVSRIPRLVEVKLSDTRTNEYVKEPVSNKKKKIKRLKRNSSPEMQTGNASPPPTEVARWAPASVNPHTKPYYDAWVNTTLAAISRNAAKDKNFLRKENLIRTFQRIIEERPQTPELKYVGFDEEKYAGRITVHHKTIDNGNSCNTAVQPAVYI